MRSHLFLSLFLVLPIVASVSHAATITCAGVPEEVMIWGNGQNWLAVRLEGHPGPWILCDLNGDYGGVAAKNCNAIYGALMSALAAGNSLRVKFDDTNYTACEAFPAWNTQLPVDFRILSIGK
jgi:hypothetical protein